MTPPRTPRTQGSASITAPSGLPSKDSIARQAISWLLATLPLVVLVLAFLVAYASLNHANPDAGRARAYHAGILFIAVLVLLPSLALLRRRLPYAALSAGAGLALGVLLVALARHYEHDSGCQTFVFDCTTPEDQESTAPGIVLLGVALLVATVVGGIALRQACGTLPLNVSSLGVSTAFAVASGYLLLTLDREARRAAEIATNQETPAAAVVPLLGFLLLAVAVRRRR